MIKTELSNDIALIKIEGASGNLLHSPDFMAIEALQELLAKNNSKAMIISGTGRHFSSGANLQSLTQQVADDTLEMRLKKGKALLDYIYELDIPVIAAVEGACFGGGLEIALSAHIRVLSEKSLLAFPETMHHLMPGLGGTYKLKRFLTLGRSIEMILRGHTLNAEDALELGLADYLCPPKNTLPFSLQLAENLTRNNSLEVIKSVMKALKNSYELPKEEALEKETELFCVLAKKMAARSQEKA